MLGARQRKPENQKENKIMREPDNAIDRLD